MSAMKIMTGCVYDHERYGRVLVTGIAEMYQEWDGGGRRPSDDVLVFFQAGLDDYNGSDPGPTSVRAKEFQKEASFVMNASDLGGDDGDN